MAYCSPAKPRSGYITARDQSMVESGVTEAGKTLPVFTLYTVFTNGGHGGKNWCLVMKARRWRINKNCK